MVEVAAVRFFDRLNKKLIPLSQVRQCVVGSRSRLADFALWLSGRAAFPSPFFCDAALA